MSSHHNSDGPEAEEWSSTSDSKRDPKKSKLNPELTVTEVKHGKRPGDVYVHKVRTHDRVFHRIGPGHFIATEESDQPTDRAEKAYRTLKRFLVGHRLESSEETHQRLNKLKALAVFGSDAISSSAYATEASLIVLMTAGNAALGVSFYTAFAIAVILSIVAFSYRQTVYAYPQGGGSYNVSRENLGELSGLVAAASLMIDYILTVSVSIVAGSAAVLSAIIASGFGEQLHAVEQLLPPFFNVNVLLSLFFIGLITLANLRGIRESGSIFAVLTYLFIVSLSIMLVVGVFKAMVGTLTPTVPPPTLSGAEPLTLWLILRAFSAGAVAMSGTEAISNGVPSFEKPESKNAATTLTVMAALLGAFFLGVSYLATQMGLVPGKETIISQIAASVFGINIFYYIFQIATMGILVIAANTAFNGFPRLASVMARDNFMPHQFLFRGDRLAFTTGIAALGAIASVLVIVFEGNVDSLIHLYAVGVFLSFTLSNAGMVVHWWKTRGERWQTSLAINGIGAVLTAIILVIVAVTKFAEGAWIVILLIPFVVAGFLKIHRHYERVAEQLQLGSNMEMPQKINQLVLVPIDDLNYASLRALAFARTIAGDGMVAVHVSTNPERAEKIKLKMAKHAPDARFIILDSPYRAFVRPLLKYIDALHAQSPDAFVTIVLPEFITAHWWEKFLHNRTASRLRDTFERHPNVAVVLVPYLLEK